MDEAIRREYLDALGIIQYVPRDSLDPLAEASDEIQAPQVEVVDQPPEHKPPARAKTKPAGLASLDIEVPKKTRVRQEKPEETAKKIVEPVAALKLQFALWQPVDDVLVVDDSVGAQAESQVQADGEVSAQQCRLLRNILAAINFPAADTTAPENLAWPPFAGHQDEAGDRQAAAEYLQTFLQARLSARPARYLLLMGSSTAEWFAAENSASKTCPQVFKTPGLQEMLDDPRLKRKTWEVVQPLAARSVDQ